MASVFLLPLPATTDDASLARGLEALWQQAGCAQVLRAKDLTAIKTHFGEPGTTTHVQPRIIATLARLVGATEAKPFVTDSAVLYASPRANAVSHALVAHAHGFGVDAMGAPFVPADGLLGNEEVEFTIGGKHFDKVAIGATIAAARSLLVVSHATGHLGTGFAATLKNLGMGCGSRKAKLRMHHGHQPKISAKRCTACGTCAAHCPADAIIVGKVAVIDGARCIGCGECIAECRDDAVTFGWGKSGAELQERIVEHAAAVVRSKIGRIFYFTVAQQITKDCDCMGRAQRPVLEDLGIFASSDPVALDQAVLDGVTERTGRRLEDLTFPQLDGSLQLAYAEQMGLGSRRYELVRVME